MNTRYALLLGFFFVSLLVVLGVLSWAQPHVVALTSPDSAAGVFLFRFTPLLVGLLVGVVVMLLILFVVETGNTA